MCRRTEEEVYSDLLLRCMFILFSYEYDVWCGMENSSKFFSVDKLRYIYSRTLKTSIIYRLYGEQKPV